MRWLPVVIIVFKVIKFMVWDVKDVQAATLDPYAEMKKTIK